MKTESEDVKIGTVLKDIPKFMSSIWNMKSPQIIIPIITGVSNFKNWKNQKLEDQFKKGVYFLLAFFFVIFGQNGYVCGPFCLKRR